MPFVEEGSAAYAEGSAAGYFVRSDSPVRMGMWGQNGKPGFFPWWNAQPVVALDVTNPAAVDWFVARLRRLQETTGIDGFKFDAGVCICAYACVRGKGGGGLGRVPQMPSACLLQLWRSLFPCPFHLPPVASSAPPPPTHWQASPASCLPSLRPTHPSPTPSITLGSTSAELQGSLQVASAR